MYRYPLFTVLLVAAAWGPHRAVCQRTSTPAPADGVLTVVPPGCNCVATSQYNPVCASDGNTYSSMQMLTCYQQCGATNARYVRLGVCRRRQDVST